MEIPIRAKRCESCGRNHSGDEFAGLPLPSNGVGFAHGLFWRNCHCGSTLAVAVAVDYNPQCSGCGYTQAACGCWECPQCSYVNPQQQVDGEGVAECYACGWRSDR